MISDACRGLVEAAAEVYPGTDWQRCAVHFYRNVFSHVPNGKVAEIARMLKAIDAQEDRRAAESKAKEIVARLKEMKPRIAAELVEQKVGETRPTMPSPQPTGTRCAQIIRSSGLFVRSDGAPAWS
jgi:putative transposase